MEILDIPKCAKAYRSFAVFCSTNEYPGGYQSPGWKIHATNPNYVTLSYLRKEEEVERDNTAASQLLSIDLICSLVYGGYILHLAITVY